MLKKPYTFIPLKRIVLLISLLSNKLLLEIQLGIGIQEKNSLFCIIKMEKQQRLEYTLHTCEKLFLNN